MSVTSVSLLLHTLYQGSTVTVLLISRDRLLHTSMQLDPECQLGSVCRGINRELEGQRFKSDWKQLTLGDDCYWILHQV